MKNSLSLLFLILLSTSAANAEPAAHVSRVDLFETCVGSANKKEKTYLPETYTPAELDQLDPYELAAIIDECTCTIKSAFKHLSQDTIQAFNISMKKGLGDIAVGNSKASTEFRKTGVMDKQINCKTKSILSTELGKKLDELYAAKSKK